MGLTKRPLYKAPRPPARKTGLLKDVEGLVTLPDANHNEIRMALNAVCLEAGFVCGQTVSYDRNRDEFVMVGKSLETGIAQDCIVEGWIVALAIKEARLRYGGKFDKDALVRPMTFSGLP